MNDWGWLVSLGGAGAAMFAAWVSRRKLAAESDSVQVATSEDVVRLVRSQLAELSAERGQLVKDLGLCRSRTVSLELALWAAGVDPTTVK